MSASIIARIVEKVFEKAVARRVAAEVVVNEAARVTAQRTATVAASAANEVVGKLITSGSRKEMVKILAQRSAIIDRIVTNASNQAVARGANYAEIQEIARVTREAAIKAFQEANTFITNNTAESVPLELLKKHQERIVEIAAEGAVESSLSPAHLVGGVIAFVPLPGWDALEEKVIEPAIDSILIPAALAMVPGSGTASEMLTNHQEVASILKELRETDDEAIDAALRERNMNGVWASAGGNAPSVNQSTLSQNKVSPGI
ncbi:MAG: hypothetical protein K1X66_08140 [Verrucomicrobiae bacterium]|nr:hypothetical protein [Verrucomicrobiae bacterium]